MVAELVNRHHAGQPDAGLNMAMAADLGIVAHDDIVAQMTIMPNMHPITQQVIAADKRLVGYMLG
jgi:hypothetical protein